MVESNLSEIPCEVIRKLICETIETKLQSKNFDIIVSSASKEGENNFCGVVYRVTFNREDESYSKFNMIVKMAPQNETRRTLFHSREMFLQEIYIYTEVLPFFRQFEQSKGVIIEEYGFVEYPKCYRSIDEEPSECLLLEDLSVRKFSIIDRYTEDVTADHVHLVMRALGKLHAFSFALKDQQPEKFHELASNLNEVFIRSDDPLFREFYNKLTETLLKVLNEKEDAHVLAKLKKLFERDAIDLAADCLDLESTGSGSVISYGDAWQNNTMFRYDNAGKPIEVCFLDWQVSRHASPILDIVYFMFCCTTKELRDEHYDDFLKGYHESLSAHIRKLGSDPEKLFPYTLMQEHFRKFGKYGLILASALLPMVTAEKGNGIDLDEAANEVANNQNTETFENLISEKSRDKFNKRMRGVAVDMVRLGYV